MIDSQTIGGILYRTALAGADDNNVMSLYRRAFNEDFSAAWFKWFNYSCPCGANRLYVAEDPATSRIVGSWGLLPYRIKLNDRVVGGSLASNLCTDPEYQRRGIFLNIVTFALAREKEYGGKISLTAPNRDSAMGMAAMKGYLKVGFDTISGLDFIASYHNEPARFRSEPVGRFTEEFDPLLAKSVGQMNFAVYKDHRFLNWRYFDRPEREYHAYAYRDAGDILGLVVLKYFDDNGYKKAHILDLYALNVTVFDDLLKAAQSFASAGDCRELNCWQIGNSPYKAGFSRHGFQPSGKKYALLLSNNSGAREAPVERDWWFMLGDNDVY